MPHKRRETGFAAQLRKLREDSGLTLAQLADAANMHLQSLSKLERGERGPNWSTVLDLAEALGCTPNDFLPVETEPPAKGKKSPRHPGRKGP